MAYNVLDIAKKLIKMADDDIANGGDNLTNLKLQKLLYYEQGFHLAKFDDWTEEAMLDYLKEFRTTQAKNPLQGLL